MKQSTFTHRQTALGGAELPHRVQQRRKKGWRKPPNTISVARPSRWGNPFEVPLFGLDLSLALFRNTACGIWSPDAIPDTATNTIWESAYWRHQQWLKRLGGHPLELAPAELRGKNLMCFCPLDQPCHADVLLELANGEGVA